MKEAKVIFEGDTQTDLTHEEAVEKVKKIVYEQSKKYMFVSTDEAKGTGNLQIDDNGNQVVKELQFYRGESIMEKELKEFLEREPALKATMEQGKDVYATIASVLYHNQYEDNLEYSEVYNNINYEGKLRRNNVKRLVLAAFLGDISYLTEFDPKVQ